MISARLLPERLSQHRLRSGDGILLHLHMHQHDTTVASYCAGTVIEHVTGVRECTRLGEQCFADWHEGGLVVCDDVYGSEHACPSQPRPSEHGAATVTWSLPPIRR